VIPPRPPDRLPKLSPIFRLPGSGRSAAVWLSLASMMGPRRRHDKWNHEFADRDRVRQPPCRDPPVRRCLQSHVYSMDCVAASTSAGSPVAHVVTPHTRPLTSRAAVGCSIQLCEIAHLKPRSNGAPDGENRVRSPPRERLPRSPPHATKDCCPSVARAGDRFARLELPEPPVLVRRASCTPGFRYVAGAPPQAGPWAEPTAAAASRPGRAGAIRWHAVGARRRGRAAWVGRCHKSWHREQPRGVVLLRARPMLAAGSLEGSTMPGDATLTTGVRASINRVDGRYPPAVTRRRSALRFLCSRVQSDL